MEFHSFSFGDMQVAQADPASQKIVAVDVRLMLKSAEPNASHLVTVHVQVPTDDGKSIGETQGDAYAAARAVLRAAADLCASRSAEELKAMSDQQVITTNKSA